MSNVPAVENFTDPIAIAKKRAKTASQKDKCYSPAFGNLKS
jgi:hypothetical protein